MTIGLVDYGLCANMHVDADSDDASVVVTQGKGSSYRIVGMTGRPLTATEKLLPRLELLLILSLYGLKHFSRITLHVPVTIVVPS